MARAAGSQGSSAPGALLLRRQLRVTRASTEGALRIGSPSTLRGPSLLRRTFQSRLWLWPGLWPGLGLGMAAPLRLVVPSATSIVAKREYGAPAGLSGLARHIFLTTIPSSKGLALASGFNLIFCRGGFPKEGGMNGLSELRECH